MGPRRCPGCNEPRSKLRIYLKNYKVLCSDCWTETQTDKVTKDDYAELKEFLKF